MNGLVTKDGRVQRRSCPYMGQCDIFSAHIGHFVNSDEATDWA